jgi:hypothetical protein
VNSLIQWLQYHQALPRDQLLIFSALSPEDLNDQLLRENRDHPSSAFPVSHFQPVISSNSPETETALSDTPRTTGDQWDPASTATSDAGVEQLAEFTPDEMAQRVALRANFQTSPDHPDADAALRRPKFARWVAQNGSLGEGL